MASSDPVTIVSELDPYLVRKYITACHILHYHELIDAYGHISVRLSNTTFLMCRYLAPALVASASDLVIYSIENGEPVGPNKPRGFSERFIHSEIYKTYPKISSVIHSHAVPVLPFTISTQPLAACFHLAGFLGQGTPVWDSDTVYSETDQQDMLVRNAKLGASLAKCLSDENDVVALMRGHGMVVVADSIEMCVLRAVYTVQNAKVLKAAKELGSEIKLLSKKEAADTANVTGMGAVKPWPLWKREVEAVGLYQNLA